MDASPSSTPQAAPRREALSPHRRFPIRIVALIGAFFALAIFASTGRAQAPPKLTRPSPATVAFWTRVQRCEEPITGWATRGSTYEGGVGFYVGTWATWARELGIYGRYPHAWMAPAWVQIAVAEYGYRVKHGYWGCIANGRI